MYKLFFLLLLIPIHANAVVFTDPTQAANMITQLQNLQEQLKAAQQQIKVFEQVQEGLNGNYGTIAKLDPEINRIIRESRKIYRTFDGLELPNGKNIDSSSIDSINEAISSIYDVNETIGNHIARDKHRQTSSHGSLVTSEFEVSDYDEKLDKLRSIGVEASDTEKLKFAVDATNKILIYQTEQIIRMSNLLAQYVRMESAYRLKGIQPQKNYHKRQTSFGRELNEGIRTGWGIKEVECPEMLKKYNKC